MSTVIRALALAEAKIADWLHITRKEFGAGGAIGLCLGTFAFPLGTFSRRRDCHFADTPSSSLLKHLLKVERGAVK